MARIRPRNLLITAAVAVSAYLLIGQLADIGFKTIADDLRHAQPAWLLTGLVVTTLGFVPEAISLRGAVATPLPLLPCVVFKSALKFVNLTVPGSAGTVAATVRFVQRMGGTATEAVASGAVDDVAEKLVQILLVLLMLPFVRDGLGNVDIHVGTPDGRLVAAIVAAIVVSVLVIWLVPAVNRKVIPPLRDGFAALRVVLRDRHKRLELFGGNAVGELTFAAQPRRRVPCLRHRPQPRRTARRQRRRISARRLHPRARRRRSRRGHPHRRTGRIRRR